LAKQLPSGTRVAVVWAGIPAYFSEFEMVDTMGYNDREIAKGRWAFDIPLGMSRAYYPGHMKYDLRRTLLEKKPDVLFQWWPAWGDDEWEMMQYRGYYPLGTGSIGSVMWFRK
jgi:hypothetical protein